MQNTLFNHHPKAILSAMAALQKTSISFITTLLMKEIKKFIIVVISQLISLNQLFKDRYQPVVYITLSLLFIKVQQFIEFLWQFINQLKSVYINIIVSDKLKADFFCEQALLSVNEDAFQNQSIDSNLQQTIYPFITLEQL